jgi:AcrR family transcriptional regulator
VVVLLQRNTKSVAKKQHIHRQNLSGKPAENFSPQMPFVRIVVDSRLYLRDPQETELGRRLLSDAVEMLNELGLESFTFSKLARSCNSTEASMYRYFHNKHELLGYLVAWYWAWLDYKVSFKTNNITQSNARLELMLQVLAGNSDTSAMTPWMNEKLLQRLVVSEWGKLQLTGEHTAASAYTHQEIFTKRIADFIHAANPHYPYPRALAGLLIQQAHQQRWYAEHFPQFTEVRLNDSANKSLTGLLGHILKSCIAHKALR